jgi:hypothetical protein
MDVPQDRRRMNTEDLIDRLSRDVAVATPLPAPGMRTAVWIVWAVTYLVVVAVMMFAFVSSAGVVPTPLYFVQQGEPAPVGDAAHRGGRVGTVAGLGRRARSTRLGDAGRDQPE